MAPRLAYFCGRTCAIPSFIVRLSIIAHLFGACQALTRSVAAARQPRACLGWFCGWVCRRMLGVCPRTVGLRQPLFGPALGRLHQPIKEWMGACGPALEFRVELA